LYVHRERRQPLPRGEIIFYVLFLALSFMVLILVARGKIRF
jgi:hypothetical protein